MSSAPDPNSPNDEGSGRYGGMPPMPGTPDGNAPRAKAPTEVTISFWIWVVGAGLVALNALVVLVFYRDQTLSLVVRANQQNSSVTDAEVRDIASTALIIALVIVLLLVGLAIFLANRMRSGRNGARIGLTVIAAIVGLLPLLGGGGASGLVSLVVVAVATVLMYLPNSSAYFQQGTGR